MPSLQRGAHTALHYEMWGPVSAPRLLVLSPSNTSLAELRTYVAGPASKPMALATSFRCLGFDYRGVGASSMPHGGWPAPGISVLVDDLLALLESVGWLSASVLGISFGGAVASELALRGSRSFEIERLLLVCPASDCGVGPGLGYPLHTLLDMGEEQRVERLLLLADTRRDSYWMRSEEGEAAYEFVLRADSQLHSTAVDGRRWLMTARANHRLLGRLFTASGLTVETDSPASTSTPLLGQRGGSEYGTAKCGTAHGGHAPACSGGTHAEGDWPGFDVAIFAAVHDGISPPSVSTRLHRAYRGSTLVWFDTGHWPNIAREAGPSFHKAAVAFCRGDGISSALMGASASLEKRIVAWDAPPAVPPADCTSAICGCVIL